MLSASYSGQTYWVEALRRQTPRPFVAARIQGAVGSEQLLAIARSVRFTER